MPLDPEILKKAREMTYGEPLVNPYPDARKLNPDAAAKGVQASRQTGVDAILAAEKLPQLQEEQDQTNWDEIVRTSPRLAKFLSNDPAAAAVSQDNTESMAEIERHFRDALAFGQASQGKIDGKPYRYSGTLSASRGPKATLSTVLSGQAGVIPKTLDRIREGLRIEFADIFDMEDMAADALRKRERIDFRDLLETPEFDSATGRWIYGGAANIQRVAPSIAASILTRSPAVGLAGMGAQVQPEAYGKYRARGGMPGEAALGSGLETAIEIGTEMIPMGFLVDKFGKTGFKSFIAGYLGRELPTELVAEISQAAVDTAIANPDKTWDQYFSELPETVGQTVVSTLMLTGGLAAAHEVARRIASSEDQIQQQAEQSASFIENINALAAADKVLQRDSETFQTFVAAAAEDGPVDTIYLDSRMLMQSGLVPDLVKVSPAVAAQIDSAILTGGAIAIPVDEYAARIAPTELAPKLLDHLKTDPNGFTRAEATDYMANIGTDLQADVERVISTRADADTFSASQEAVKQEVLGQLNTAGRFTPQVNEAYATLASSYAAVRADQMGMTPEEFHVKHGMKVQAEAVAGQQFSQGAQPPDREFLLSDLPRDMREELFNEHATNLNPDATERAFLRKRVPSGLIDIKDVQIDEIPADQLQRYVDAKLADLPPIVIADGRLIDGQHRIQAARARGIRQLRYIDMTGLIDTDAGGYVSELPKSAYPNILNQTELQSEYEIPATKPTDRPIDRPRLVKLRRDAASIEAPSRGITFRIDEDGNAILTGPARVRVPDRFRKFAEEHGLKLVVRRGNARSGKAMPTEFRESGALYFGEMGEPGPDRTGKSLFQQEKGQPRGAFSPATNTITLLNSADLTSFLHEAAHYFFENDIAIASQLVDEARQFGYDSLKPGERQIINDVSVLLKWHGIQGEIEEQLRTWHTMDFEEQRAHHERTAESFEAYLFSGKAPSLELQPIFQRFRSWLVSVYKSIKAFLESHPEAGKLNDEVRSVFDRMIATEDEIRLAEQARSMLPMFAEQEKSGMTPEEFSAYHAQGKEATDIAISELQTKGLRDLQWMKNAKGRQIDRLKREAKGLRAEVEMEAKREVMSRPVYQAWAFLTRKMGQEDALPPLERKTDPDVIDSTLDSLFVAIAKLGGVKKEQVLSEWGIDPKDIPQSGLFGKPVWRITDGLTLDGMAEALSQYGYLPLDEHGKYDLNDFHDRFAAELSGDTQYSDNYNPQEYLPGEQIANPAGLGAGRFDLGSLEGFSDEIISVLNGRRMTAKEGLHPDLVATLFDFNSGDELVRTIAAAKPPKEAITELTDRLMLERHGELATQEAIELAADAAIHNEVRAHFVTTEYNALAKATGRPKILNAAAKQYAAEMIARLKVRDIRPGLYASAETRAAKAAAKASREGKLALAAAEKRNQALNIHATRAAYDAKDEVAAGLDYVRRRVTSVTSQKNMRGESKAQLLAILDRFDLRKSVSLKEIDRQQKLAEWAEAEADRLAAPIPLLSDAVANESVRTHYKNLTVEEFRGLIDSIKQLEHLARREQKAYLAIRNMNLEEEVAKGVAEIRAVWPEAFDSEGEAILDTPLTHRYAPSIAKKVKRAQRLANAEFIPMEELIGQLTAGKFGVLQESLFGRLSNASDRKAIMAQEIRDRMASVFKAYSVKEQIAFPRRVVGGTGMTRENILMLLLHYGNVEGRQRLASQGFNDQIVLDRVRHLEPKDLDLAEAIWSLNDDYIWPQYAALNERTQGKAPPKVQALPVQVNGRDLRGGYIKLVYDAEFDETTRQRDSMDDVTAMIRGRGRVATKTEQGSSIERVNELSKMPLLELRAVNRAINEHMHDISYREAIADTVRVLREPEMRDAIKAVSGNEVYTELLAKVNEIAVHPVDPSGIILKALNVARKNTVVVLLSGVKTALVNYSGLIPAINRVNAGLLIKNVAKTHSHRMRELIRFAKDHSAYMTERNQLFTSDMQHEMKSLTMQNRLRPEMGTFLILMRMVDQLTSTTVWLTAYEEGQKTYKDEKLAVDYADSVVRGTQGAGRDVDTSKIMTRFGPWSRVFAMFYSFFNRQLALLARQGVIAERAWNKGDKAKAVGIFTAAYVSIVVIPALINDMAAGKCDDAFDGEEGFGRCIAKSITMNMALFIPVLRDFAPYVWSKIDDKEPDWGLRMTPATAYFEGLGKAAGSVADVFQDEEDEKDTKAIFMGLAFGFGLPGKLMWDVTAGTESVINDDAELKSILFGPPKEK